MCVCVCVCARTLTHVYIKGSSGSEFELQSCYYVHFWTNTLGKGKNLLISPAMGKISPLQFFYKNGFGTKLKTKTNMPLNKEAKQTIYIYK